MLILVSLVGVQEMWFVRPTGALAPPNLGADFALAPRSRSTALCGLLGWSYWLRWAPRGIHGALRAGWTRRAIGGPAGQGGPAALLNSELPWG